MEKLKTPALILAALAALYIAGSYLILPGVAHARVIALLKESGFDVSYIKRPAAGLDFIDYRDIVFDKDGVSSLKALRVSYDPFHLLLQNKFNGLQVHGLSLTGDWSDANYSSLSFSGWKMPLNAARRGLLSFRYINVASARVSLLTRDAGGISINFSFTGARRDGALEFQGRLDSRQPALVLAAAMDGRISESGLSADIDIENGKFEIPDGTIKATRMNGSLALSAFINQRLEITGELQAGGASIFALPWQGVSANVEFADGLLKTSCEGKSVGVEGVELELAMTFPDGAPAAAEGTLHADAAANLLAYLKNRRSYEPLRRAVDKIKKRGGVDVHIQSAALPNLEYEIRREGGEPEAAGGIKIQD